MPAQAAPVQQTPSSVEGQGAPLSSDSRPAGLIPSPSGVNTGVQQSARDAAFNQQDADFKQKHAALFEASAAHFTQARVEFKKALALLPPDIASNFAKNPIPQLAEAPDNIPLLLRSTDVVQGPHSLGSKNYLLGQYATALTELTATIKLLESTQVSLPQYDLKEASKYLKQARAELLAAVEEFSCSAHSLGRGDVVEALQSHLKDGGFFDLKRRAAASVLDNEMRFFEGIQGNQGQASTPAESSKISAVESKPVPSESAPVSLWSRITGFFSGLFRTRSLATDGPSEQPVVSEPVGKDADTSTAPSKVEASTITAVTNEVEAQLRIACERGQRRASDNWSSAVVHVAVIGIVEAPRRS